MSKPFRTAGTTNQPSKWKFVEAQMPQVLPDDIENDETQRNRNRRTSQQEYLSTTVAEAERERTEAEEKCQSQLIMKLEKRYEMEVVRLEMMYESEHEQVLELERLNINERKKFLELEKAYESKRQEFKELEKRYHQLVGQYEDMIQRERRLVEEWKEKYDNERRNSSKLQDDNYSLKAKLAKVHLKLKEMIDMSQPRFSLFAGWFDSSLNSVNKALQELYKEIGSESSSISSRTFSQIDSAVPKRISSIPRIAIKIPVVISSSHLKALNYVAAEFISELQKVIDVPQNLHVDFKVISEPAESLNQLDGPCSLVLAWSCGRIGWDERKSLFALRQGFGDQRYLVMFRKTDVVVSNDKTRKDQPRDVEIKKLPEQITKIVDIYYSRDSKLLRDEPGDLISENLNNIGILAEWISKIVDSDS